jgi:hypothetical protein
MIEFAMVQAKNIPWPLDCIPATVRQRRSFFKL